MKRGQYVRLIEYELTTGLKAPDLYTLSLVSTPVLTMEGWLTEHILLGGRIHLTARYRQGQMCLGEFRSARVVRIAVPYILTRDSLYSLFRVPPSRPNDTFADFA